MTLQEFFTEFETIAMRTKGSIRGDERLDAMEGWDSFAVVEFMSMADERLGVQLEPAQLATCRQVNDLAVLCGLKP